MSRTWHKILLGALYGLLALAAGCYFYAASHLYAAAKKDQRCQAIRVQLLDSSLNQFVSKEEVINLICNYDKKIIGRRLDSINLENIENLLNKKSMVKNSEVFLLRDGLMSVKIVQRRPIIRVETKEGGFYIDDSAFAFPLIERYTSHVPVVSGNLSKKEGKTMKKVLELGKFIAADPFWKAEVEQIYFKESGDVALALHSGRQEIVLGDLSNIPDKFSRLYSFYIYVIPKTGWNKYRSISVKYKRQIVCKKI